MSEADPAVLPVAEPDPIPAAMLAALACRERITDRYWRRRDPINPIRIWWRASIARHLFHVLPGESILELACGSGTFTPALVGVTRGECPITSATFDPANDLKALKQRCRSVEAVTLASFPGGLRGRQFDYVVASNVLDVGNVSRLLTEVQALLRPGGRLLFFEANPWNPVFRIRGALGAWLPFLRRGDERTLPNQVQLYEILSELGYISLGATCYDFLYPPIPSFLMMIARNLTLVMENTGGVKRLAGSILLHAQKPPRGLPRPAVRMTEHRALHDSVSVVVPCYNEEMNLAPLVNGLLNHYDEYLHEIILVDDNSKDRSRAIMEAMAASDPRIRPVFRAPPNGVGLALADGMKAARGRYVLLMDCDFLHILPELREMFDRAADGADVVLGSRFSRESVLINYPLQKILCNRSFHVLLSLIFRRRMLDVTNNLKLLRREVVEDLDLEAPWFAANAETGLKPILMGCDVRKAAVSWINRTPEMGQSSFSLLRFGAGYVKVLAALAWRTRLGARLLPRRSRTEAPTPERLPQGV